MRTCAYCSQQVSLNSPGTFQKVTGWAERRGATGGANGVRMREDHDEFAHRNCIDLAAKGHRFGQQAMDLGSAA